MRGSGYHYSDSRVECYDLDHAISLAVNRTKEFVNELKELGAAEEDIKAILKACASTIIDEL